MLQFRILMEELLMVALTLMILTGPSFTLAAAGTFLFLTLYLMRDT